MFHGQSKISMFSKAILAGALAAGAAFAQPDPPPAPYLPCEAEPTGAGETDTVASGVNACGWISLFDGATDKGWYQGCNTGHGGPAKWKIVPEQKAIFSTQDGTKGSILMTNRKNFLHYELQWDYWPDYGNDGGLFNRTPNNGNCFQTVLDYIGGAAIGGTWGEGGFTGRDYRPFSFAGNEKTITIPGNNQGEPSNWTTMTSKMKAAGHKFDCPTTGCTQADWNKLWDFDGYNQLRLQFYGGVAGNNRVRMKFWFRKPGASDWVPVSFDTTLMQVIPANHIGLQVHGGGRFGGAKGTWYKNIKWTPLTENGAYIYPKAAEPVCEVGVAAQEPFRSALQMDGTRIMGEIDMDHVITATDLNGKTVKVIRGKAGHVEYHLGETAPGWVSLQIKTAKGVVYRSLSRNN